ncbi:MAG: hypothetical protein KAS25_04490 [Dehalococcoidales bacterium]|nr:hypothetical protein [Dehalococcoidales bacterium]
MIRTVIRIKNNMVMVFDEEGEQMPEFQGYYEDVKERILANASGGSVFNHWFELSPEQEVVPSEAW